VGGEEWGVEAQLHAFLSSVVGGGDSSASRFRCHISRKMALCSYSVADGMGPRVNTDALKKTKSLSLPGIETEFLSRLNSRLITVPTELFRLKKMCQP
jgi:hypothetical protein